MLRVALLSSHEASHKSLELLHSQNALVGIGTCDSSNRSCEHLRTFAMSNNIPYIQASKNTNKRISDLKNWAKKIHADIIIINNFNYDVTETLLNIPKMGVYHFDSGNIAQYKGPDPAFWQIKNKQKDASFTVYKANNDSSILNIICQEAIPFIEDESYTQLQYRLGNIAKYLTLRVVSIIERYKGKPPVTKHPITKRVWQPRPTLKDISIDWYIHSATQIHSMVLAASPLFKGALTYFKEHPLWIVESSLICSHNRFGSIEENYSTTPGAIAMASKGRGCVIRAKGKYSIKLDVVFYKGEYLSGSRFAVTHDIGSNDHFGNITEPPLLKELA